MQRFFVARFDYPEGSNRYHLVIIAMENPLYKWRFEWENHLYMGNIVQFAI